MQSLSSLSDAAVEQFSCSVRSLRWAQQRSVQRRLQRRFQRRAVSSSPKRASSSGRKISQSKRTVVVTLFSSLRTNSRASKLNNPDSKAMLSFYTVLRWYRAIGSGPAWRINSLYPPPGVQADSPVPGIGRTSSVTGHKTSAVSRPCIFKTIAWRSSQNSEQNQSKHSKRLGQCEQAAWSD